MGITASDSGGSSYPPTPEGVHHGVCYGIYDLGTQYSEKFNNKARKVLIQWELPEERIDIDRDGETFDLPRVASKQYTVSLHEKSNLRHDLESWRGKSFTAQELEGFDLSKLMGVNAMIQIIHKKRDKNTYANVAAVLPPYDKTKKFKPENQEAYFSFEDGTPIPESAPAWIIDIIKQAEEWENAKEPWHDEEPPLPEDDDIPF